jgi:hypothetical protein
VPGIFISAMSVPPALARLLAGHRNTLGPNPTPAQFRQHG